MVRWHLIYGFMFSLCLSADLSNTKVVMKMDTFLALVQDIELSLTESSSLAVAKLLLLAVTPPFQSEVLSEGQAALAHVLLTHKIVGSNETGWQEQGVVLAPDGSSVALRPFLGAVVKGWNDDFPCEQVESANKNEESGHNVNETQPHHFCAELSSSHYHQGISSVSDHDDHPATLATALGLAFLASGVAPEQPLELIDGCWDSLSAPWSFQLQALAERGLTLAYLNGAVDGTLLGKSLRNESEGLHLSALIQQYYWGKPSKSAFRRQEFQSLIQEENMEAAISRAMYCFRKSKAGCSLQSTTDDQLDKVAATAAKAFKQHYLECPAIIPRCMWQAKPYKGTPTFLKLPLAQIYIHHTYTPSQPCTSFKDCCADMRSMQDFHQQDRGWDDIGYSFVVGSDGYVYEGRGWLWVGAHTKGHNSIGYGVSFIGNFMSLLPEERILSLVRDRFVQCAVRSGYVSSNYTLWGHRQLVNTSCPGDFLYNEIKSWKNFKGT